MGLTPEQRQTSKSRWPLLKWPKQLNRPLATWSGSRPVLWETLTWRSTFYWTENVYSKFNPWLLGETLQVATEQVRSWLSCQWHVKRCSVGLWSLGASLYVASSSTRIVLTAHDISWCISYPMLMIWLRRLAGATSLSILNKVLLNRERLSRMLKYRRDPRVMLLSSGQDTVMKRITLGKNMILPCCFSNIFLCEESCNDGCDIFIKLSTVLRIRHGNAWESISYQVVGTLQILNYKFSLLNCKFSKRAAHCVIRSGQTPHPCVGN